MKKEPLESIEGKLDDRYKKHFEPLVKKYKMTELNKKVYSSHAVISAKSENIIISLVNDRGILEFSISLSWREYTVGDVAIVISKLPDSAKRKWAMRTKSFVSPLEVQSSIFDEYWSQIQALFSKDNFENTFPSYVQSSKPATKSEKRKKWKKHAKEYRRELFRSPTYWVGVVIFLVGIIFIILKKYVEIVPPLWIIGFMFMIAAKYRVAGRIEERHDLK